MLRVFSRGTLSRILNAQTHAYLVRKNIERFNMAVAIPSKRKYVNWMVAFGEMLRPTADTSRWADVATVSLIVGETQTAFHVHEADLFEASPFFKAAFTSDFRESSERTMTLPEDDENTFELFVDWLYHRHYEIPSHPKPPEKDVFMQPVKFFVLADKYDVRSLKNLIVSKIFLAFKQNLAVPRLSTISYAYKHTSQSSTIRKMLTDNMTRVTDLTWFQEAKIQTWLRNHPDVSAELNASFAKRMLKQIYPFVEEMPEGYMEEEASSIERDGNSVGSSDIFDDLLAMAKLAGFK